MNTTILPHALQNFLGTFAVPEALSVAQLRNSTLSTFTFPNNFYTKLFNFICSVLIKHLSPSVSSALSPNQFPVPPLRSTTNCVAASF
jgi:hypothetical protein